MSRSVGYVYAVDGVSFELQEGRTLGLVGESGCGKTTTGLAILNLVKPTSGQVIFRGQDISRIDKKERRKLTKEMQIIFQDPYSSLNPRMTVRQILSNPMEIHGLYPGRERADRIAFLLEKVGLSPEQANHYPHEFSGGQRQRIGIARALSFDPSLIIGDEPVSALDVSIQAQIINLLMDLQDEFHLSYLIISHDLAVVEHVCDSVAVMYLGRIIELSSHSQLYLDPKHPYTQALMSAVPVPDPANSTNRIALQGDVPSPFAPPPGCHFHPRCPARMEACAHAYPPSVQVAGGHWVNCHLYTKNHRPMENRSVDSQSRALSNTMN